MMLMDNQTDMTALKKMILPVALALLICGVQPCVGSVSSDVFLRLQASRNALLAQERDIQVSYDEVTHEIDELREKQALLDSYLAQTRDAIRGVDKAMRSAQ
jgi:septal ring factor EnvC (AmiA/AmiB activator)